MADITTMMYHHHQHHHSTPSSATTASALTKSASVRSKRKSAVELLAESKPLYVKSECVRDREVALPQRCSDRVGGNVGAGGGGYGTYTRSKSIGAATVGSGQVGGYVISGGRNQAGQVSTVMMPQQYMAVVSPSRSLPPLSHHTSHHRRTIHSSTALISTPSSNSTPTTLGYQPPPPLQPVNISSNNNSDLLQTRLRQLLVNCTPTNCATVDNGSIGGTLGSSNGATGTDSMEDVLLSVEQLGPLSPPAEYATTCTVADSSSKSGGGCGGGVMAGVGSQRCHKSLPDLHCRGEPSSNKSSNKSLSNRDSGGSSGHYTQHSEPPPPPRQEVRRDSGSSTQHSGASSYYCCQEAECRAAARAQQQAYAAAAAIAAANTQQHTIYQPPLMQQPQMQQQQYGGGVSQLGQMQLMLMQRDVGYCAGMMSVPVQQQPTTVANSLQPPVTFKRQKCLRYKRDRPILRSKSDISDRYWRPPEPPISHLEQFFEHLGLTSDRYEDMFSLSGRSSASPVFFSDVSTVDSSAPMDTAISAGDYTNSGAQPSLGGGCTTAAATAAAFRPNEPPSIVERNARIIKWLCHCRKAQML